MLQVDGDSIQPFGYQLRADFLHSLDDAVSAISLQNIELLAVEEFLPASGPSAESLSSLMGGSSAGGGYAATPNSSSSSAPTPGPLPKPGSAASPPDVNMAPSRRAQPPSGALTLLLSMQSAFKKCQTHASCQW